MMNTFDFHLDEKIEVWQRHSISVKADTQDEAEAFIREKGLASDSDWIGEDIDGRVGHLGSEILFETQETISVEENGGRPTIEITTMDKKRVADNGDETLKNRETKELCVFLFPVDEMERNATDGEIVAAWESEENDEREWPVEKLTPDEFACRLNDDDHADQRQWVRFIEI
jgi:hypothetical protein